MFLVLVLNLASSVLIAVVEIGREASSTPKYLSDWSEYEPGVISSIGVIQQQKLGKTIRDRYSDVIYNNFYNNSYILVKNNNVTVSSLITQLIEIYGSNYKPNLNLFPEDQDLMLSPEKSCKRIQYLLQNNIKKFESNDLYINLTHRNDEVYKIIGNVTVEGIYRLGDFIIRFEEQNFTIPMDIEGQTKDLVKEVYHKYHEWLLYGSLEQAKLSLSMVLGKLIEYFETLIKFKTTQKFFPVMMDQALFLAFLHIIGLDYSPKPPGSAVFLEIHEIAGRHKIRFFYNDKYIESEVCGLECKIEDMITHLDSKLLKPNTKSACEIIGDPEEGKLYKYLAAVSILILLILISKYWDAMTKVFIKSKDE